MRRIHRLRFRLAGLHSNSVPNEEATGRKTLEEAEREHNLATLKETEWIISGPRGAAARLGMNRSTLQFRMRKLAIVRPWTQRRARPPMNNKDES
jgi:formate hydrogenlyase transcriptional activator